MTEIADHIAVTLAAIVGPSEGWDYYLDLLDLVEKERDWLASTSAPWPPGTEDDRRVYRVALIGLEGRLRRFLEQAPLDASVIPQASDEISDVLGEWIQAGKRIMAAGEAGPAH